MPEDTYEDIRRALFDAAWEAPAFAPAPERTVTRARRRATATIGSLAAGAVAAVVAAILAFIGDGPLANEDRTAENVRSSDPREFVLDLRSGDRVELHEFPRGSSQIDVSSDGASYAFVAPDDGGVAQVWVMRTDGSGLRQLTDDPFETMDPAWSPDRRSIAYVAFGSDRGADRDVFVVDVATGRSRIASRESDDPYLPDWSPDGRQILYTVNVTISEEGGTADGSHIPQSFTISQLRIVDLETRRVVAVVGGRDEGAYDGDWSLATGRIAYMREPPWDLEMRPQRTRLVVIDAIGEQEVELADIGRPGWWPTWSPDGTKIAYFRYIDGREEIVFLDLRSGRTRTVSAAGHGWFTWIDDDTALIQELPPPS